MRPGASELQCGFSSMVVLAMLITSAYAQEPGGFDPLVCPFKGDVSYEPGEIECGLLAVPENRSDPASRTIELHFVRIRAKTPEDKRDDPVVFLSGGPGGQITSFALNILKDHGIADHRDLYVLEQRGVGVSADFCPHFFDRNIAKYTAAETYGEFHTYERLQFEECFNRARAAGVDVDAYNTAENGQDVRALREALGFTAWNVWGVSYGSLLGQAVLRTDPEGVRAIVLDGIVPISGEDVFRIGRWYRRDLNLLLEACQEQPACRDAYPDLETSFMDAIRAVEQSPIVFEAEDTELFPRGEGRIFHDFIATLPFLMFYIQDDYPALPATIDALSRAALERDTDTFKAIALLSGSFGGNSAGMAQAVLCRDGPFDDVIAQMASDREEEPLLSTASPDLFDWAICQDTGLTQFDSPHFELIETSTPAVIANGSWDPITPPDLATKIVPGFSNGTYVEFPYAGHGPTSQLECAGDFMTGFFDDPASPVDRSCADQVEAPVFWGSLFETSAVARAATMAMENPGRLALQGAPLAGSLLVLLLAFILIPLSAAARRIDKIDARDTGGARLFSWLGAAAGLIYAGVLGYATYLTFDASPLTLPFGLIGWTRYVSFLTLAAIALGFTAVVLTIKARKEQRLNISGLLGLFVAGAAAIVLGVAAIMWDLGPF